MRRSSSRRTGAGALVTLAALAALACGGSSRDVPVASLSSSPRAERAFEAVRDAWERYDQVHDDLRFAVPTAPVDGGVADSHAATDRLRAQLSSFLATYPDDGLSPVARAYLAFVEMEEGSWELARADVARLSTLPEGSTQNLVTIADARLLRHDQRPDAALELLRPMVGKVVDPIARVLFLEEIALDAVAARRDYEALAYLDAWLRGVGEDKREAVRASVEKWIAALPARVLEDTYRAMRQSRGESGYGGEMERLVGERLAAIAVQRGDSRLARWLLDPDAGTFVGGDAGSEVAELATSLRGLDSVSGRTLGVLLPASSPALRDLAAGTMRGLAWALDLPRIDPYAADGVRLVTQDDGGDAANADRGLEELVGEGAAVLVAGFEPVSAARAIAWGARRHIAVVTIANPLGLATSPKELGPFGFTTGETRARELQSLVNAMTAAHLDRLGLVARASSIDEPLFAEVAAGHAQNPVGTCGLTPARAGDPTLPFAVWARGGVKGVLAMACARQAMEEAEDVAASWTFGLPLDSATARLDPGPRAGRIHRLALGAGDLPVLAHVADPLADLAQVSDADLRAYIARAAVRPSWSLALGRDAGRLARIALATLPLDTSTDKAEVEHRRLAARDALAAAHLHLWTSEHEGFDSAHVLPRTLRVVELPPPK
jgi:hypothetical protein